MPEIIGLLKYVLNENGSHWVSFQAPIVATTKPSKILKAIASIKRIISEGTYEAGGLSQRLFLALILTKNT